jgi:hypothetical protein
MIQHEGLVTLYGHLETVTVADGQQVVAGQTIGTLGKTDGFKADLSKNVLCNPVTNPLKPHLHFEVKEALTLGFPRTDRGNGWSYTPAAAGKPIPLDQPDAFGYFDPVLHLTANVQAAPFEIGRVTEAGTGRNLHMGPGTRYTHLGATVARTGEDFRALMWAPDATPGCSEGWYQIEKLDKTPDQAKTYFTDTHEVPATSTDGWLPDAWICRGDSGQIWVEESDLDLATLKLSRPVVAGCLAVSGTVGLTRASASSVTVGISDTLESAAAPTSVTIPAGYTSKSISVKTSPVSLLENGQVNASFVGTSRSVDLAVRPIGVASVTLTPTKIVGGQVGVGSATLECNAGPGPIRVDLWTSNPVLAAPLTSSINIPVGQKNSSAFFINTIPVVTTTSATIAATANGVQKSKSLTLLPAASVSPTSLRFGSVPVGTTSVALNATLTNKGAVAFAVNSISLTGTYATWYEQTNNCPANLAAGTSCTISVRFTPQAALSKSAKLAVATSATSTPLSVSLSGTGI